MVKIMDMRRETRVEIDLKALESNVLQIKRLAGDKKIIAVVKANAYGHGDDIICPALKNLGVNHFAVSCAGEALHINKYVKNVKNVKNDGEILIFGFTPLEYLDDVLAENNIILSVGGIDYARMLNNHILNNHKTAKKQARVHIKLNTGMNRAGINAKEELKEILSLPALKCEAVYTHFSCAESPDEDDRRFTENQHEKLLDFARDSGLEIHSQNSGGLLLHERLSADYVRVGLILYGLSPVSEISEISENADFIPPFKLKPVMTFKSNIQQIRTLEAGDFVSYGRTYKASEKRLAALVPVGYSHGYSRLNSNKGPVAIKNTLCPVLGRVCMEQTMIDVSGADGVKVGDEVLLYSGDFKETSIEYIADKLGTIPYEITCAINGRVERKIINC